MSACCVLGTAWHTLGFVNVDLHNRGLVRVVGRQFIDDRRDHTARPVISAGIHSAQVPPEEMASHRQERSAEAAGSGKRMSWRVVAVLSGVLGALLFVAFGAFSYGVQIAYIRDDPPSAFGYFTAAFLLAFACASTLLALLLVTNTRRPRGIDPDLPPQQLLGFDQATLDAFSLTTDDVLKHEKKRVRPEHVSLDDEPPRPRRSLIIDEQGEAYGRRRTDIPMADIKRTIEAVQQIKGAGGVPDAIISVPEWAKAIVREGEKANGAAADTGRGADLLDLQPAGHGADQGAGADDPVHRQDAGLPDNELSGD